MEVVRKYIGYIIAAGLLLLLANNCVNKMADNYFGEGNVIEKQLHNKIEIMNAEKRKSDKLRDSLEKENKKKDSEIATLKTENNRIDSERNKLNNKTEKEIAKSKSFTYKESAQFIFKTYNMPNSVSYSDKGVFVSDSVPNKVVETIIERDAFKEDNSLLEQKVKNTEKQVSVLEEKVSNKDLEIKSLSDLGQKKDEVILSEQELNDNLKKQNKKLKTSRTLERILTFVGIVTGVILITK